MLFTQKMYCLPANLLTITFYKRPQILNNKFLFKKYTAFEKYKLFTNISKGRIVFGVSETVDNKIAVPVLCTAIDAVAIAHCS